MQGFEIKDRTRAQAPHRPGQLLRGSDSRKKQHGEMHQTWNQITKKEFADTCLRTLTTTQ